MGMRILTEDELVQRGLKQPPKSPVVREAPLPVTPPPIETPPEVAERVPGLGSYFSEAGGRIKQRWGIGKLQSRMADLSWGQLTGDESPETAAQIAELDKQRKELTVTHPHLLEKFVGETAEMLPMMRDVAVEALPAGTAGAGLAAAVGANPGLVAFPEEIATMPAGFGIGMTVGGGAAMGKKEAGLAYQELLSLRDKGGNAVDPKIAKAIALTIGGINGALEMGKIKMLIDSFPGSKGIVRKALQTASKKALNSPRMKKFLANRAVRTGLQYAGTVAGETGQEVLQESVNITGEEIGKELSNILDKTQFGGPEFKNEIWPRLWETTVRSAMGFALMPLPGAAVQSAVDVVDIVKEKSAQKAHLADIQALLDRPDAVASAEEVEAILASLQPRQPEEGAPAGEGGLARTKEPVPIIETAEPEQEIAPPLDAQAEETVTEEASQAQDRTDAPGVKPKLRAEGDVLTSKSGRAMAPFPKVSTETNRKAANTTRRVDVWLASEAIKEAESRGDEFAALQFKGIDPKKMSQADRDSAHDYVLGDLPHPPVPKSILKPLAPASESAPETALPPREVPTPAKARQPWEMTKEELIDYEISQGVAKWGGREGGSVSIVKRTPKGVKWSDGSFTPYADSRGYNKLMLLQDHENAVKKALSEGKAVPPEVLKNYPDLAAPEKDTEKDAEATDREGDAQDDTQQIKKSPDAKDLAREGDTQDDTQSNKAERAAESEAVDKGVPTPAKEAEVSATAKETAPSKAAEASKEAEEGVPTPAKEGEVPTTAKSRPQKVAEKAPEAPTTPKEALAARLAKNVKDAKQKRKGSKSKSGDAYVKLGDEEHEAEYQRGRRGIQKPTVGQRVVDALKRMGKAWTREFEHLPKTKEMAELRRILLLLQKQKKISAHKTLETLHGITALFDGPDGGRKFDLFSRTVLLRDLLEDTENDLDVPIYGRDYEALQADIDTVEDELKKEEHSDVREALDLRKEVWATLKDEYVTAMDKIGFKAKDRFNKENYFHHQVLEYMNAYNQAVAGGKALQTPAYRGFLKKRGGTDKTINMNYLEAEFEVIAQMIHDIEVANSIKEIVDKYDISGELKAEKKKRKGTDDEVKKWQDIVKERDGYVLWQPEKGNALFLTQTIPERIVNELVNGSVEEIMITADMIGKAMAVGAKHREMALPTEVAVTLDNLRPPHNGEVAEFLSGISKKIMKKWKQWQLISPRRFFKYNVRNLTGDAEHVFVGNPSTFKRLPQAIRELLPAFYSWENLTGEVKEWFERGGFETLFRVQEMGDLRHLEQFQKLKDWAAQEEMKPGKVSKAILMKGWEQLRIATDFREAILRYAAYLDYLDQLDKGDGTPRNYGASLKDEVDGIAKNRDKAFWLSNDLLGAYDRVSTAGKFTREHLIPFWSWKEVNFTIYKRLLQNMALDMDSAEGKKFAKIMGIGQIKLAGNIAKMGVKLAALWGMTQAYNHLVWPEEEEDLPEHVKERPHIILGRNDDGQVKYFSRIGAMADILEWFALDSAPRFFDDFTRGKRTAKEILLEMARAPVNIIAQGAAPQYKLPLETMLKRSTYPDIFSPRVIRSRSQYLFRSVALGHEYNAVFGYPDKGYIKTLENLFWYTIVPGEGAYRDTQTLKYEWLKKQGKNFQAFYDSPRYQALYNYRLAVKYGDKDLAKKFLGMYIMNTPPEKRRRAIMDIVSGDTFKGLNPLAGMSKADKMKFLRSLTADEKRKLIKAERYWRTTLQGKGQ